MVRVDAAGKQPLWRPASLGGALTLALFLTAAPALAHRVLVFDFAEGDNIQVEAKFVPDTPVRQGKILVLAAPDGRELLSGATDDQGKFSFRIPEAAAAERLDLKIVVEAGLGHRGEWLLKAEAYLPPPAAAPAPPAVPASPAPVTAAGAARTPAAPEAPELEALLNRALERQLAPVKEMLAQLSQRRTTLPDILGGIGYILGFFGLWAYFQSRRQNRP